MAGPPHSVENVPKTDLFNTHKKVKENLFNTDKKDQTKSPVIVENVVK